MVTRWMRVGSMGEKGKGTKKYRLPVIKIVMELYIKYDIETVVNDIIITMMPHGY